MLRFLLLCLITVTGAFAQSGEDARLLAAFEKAFALPKGNRAPVPVAEKRAALTALAAFDSPGTAEALVEGWLKVDAELAGSDAERAALNDELAKLIKGQEASERRTLPQAALDRSKQIKEIVAGLRQRGDDLRELQQEVGKRIGELRRRDSLLWLLQKVCGQKKPPLPLKLAAARAVGAGAEQVMDELAAALSRAKQAPEQIVLLDAMALAGKQAQPFATPIIDLLQSKEEAVAERAALALAKLAVLEAVPPMIELLARSTGQTKMRVASALEVLTTQQFGTSAATWTEWWRAEGATFAASGVQLGSGVPSHRKATDQLYYFGIPQDQSNAILYVIDCSGSMTAKVKLDTGIRVGDAEVKEMTRLEACQMELIRALGLLRPTQKFAIMWFNDLPHWWEPKMQPATKDVVAKAQEFVARLKPASSTNIHDSLEQGFRLVGRGAHDRYYGVDLDTIFLLTDGSPTTPDGKLDSTDKILTSVRAWNPLRRVTIHTIAIGRDLNEQFLRQLASENGGEFKQF